MSQIANPFPEPPMVAFRKVRAGWYSLPIVTWEEDFASQRKAWNKRVYEEHVDVWQDKGCDWTVTIRGGREYQGHAHELNRHSLFRTRCPSFAAAKRYAVALRAYLKNEGPDPDRLSMQFYEEIRLKHEAEIEAKVGKPYAQWMAEMIAKQGAGSCTLADAQDCAHG